MIGQQPPVGMLPTYHLGKCVHRVNKDPKLLMKCQDNEHFDSLSTFKLITTLSRLITPIVCKCQFCPFRAYWDQTFLGIAFTFYSS
uniref:Uncharacterized protein n=1 Tax=Meloidogyne incognita TaxID=6306 RepID=A0A914MS80_MELIC